MDYASEYYEEVASGDEVAIAPPVVHNEPLGVNIPAPGAESLEAPAASPLPVPSEASGQGRVGIEIPRGEQMLPPLPRARHRQSTITQTTRRSGLKICKCINPGHCWGWKCGETRPGKIGGRPDSCTQFHHFQPGLQPSCSLVRGPMGRAFAVSGRESALFELQAALIGWNRGTFFERRLFLRQ